MPVSIRSMRNLNKGVKVPGTGLVLYPGGTEKTPTGESNAFVNSGLTAEDLLSYAKKYNLPTTSNRDFQKAQYELLNSTPTGRRSLEIMQKKFGKSKAGTYVDDILGARTMAMMKNTPTIGGEEHIRIVPKEIPITPLEIPKKIPDIAGLKGNYYISWPGDRSYAKENNLNHIDGYNQLPLSSYKDLEYIKNEAAKRGIEPGGYTEHKEGDIDWKNKIGENPASGFYNLNYALDRFSALDLPQDEDVYNQLLKEVYPNEVVNPEEYKENRTKIPMGIIDVKTGKFIPEETDKTKDTWKYAYLKKMTEKYPEYFDLTKSANMVPKEIYEASPGGRGYNTGRGVGVQDRKIINELNQFHPDVDSEHPRYEWKNKGVDGEVGMWKSEAPEGANAYDRRYRYGSRLDKSTPMRRKTDAMIKQ